MKEASAERTVAPKVRFRTAARALARRESLMRDGEDDEGGAVARVRARGRLGGLFDAGDDENGAAAGAGARESAGAFADRRGERAQRPRGRRAVEPRGAALVSCLVLLAALIAAGAAGLVITRSELVARGSARAARQARYTAEAGVVHALAVIAPGADFDALVAGTGGLADAGRPGPLTVPGGGWVDFPGPPFGYTVAPAAASPAADGSPRLRLDAVATAVRGARRAVRAWVGRAREPYAPAALVVASGRLSFAGAAVAGPGHGVAVDARAAARPVAAVAAASASALDAALAACRSAGAVLLGARPGGVARGFDVAAFAAASGLTPEPAGVLASGSAAPRAVRVAGGVAATLAGAGVLVVDGDLTVQGAAHFTGVVLAGGRLRLEGSPCRFDGLVWADAVDLAASCILTFDEGAVAAADAVLRLPRLPVLLGLVDVETSG